MHEFPEEQGMSLNQILSLLANSCESCCAYQTFLQQMCYVLDYLQRVYKN